MCSLEEAFAPITQNVPSMSSPPSAEEEYSRRDSERGMRSYNTHGYHPTGGWVPSTNYPSQVGQPTTQTDDRRQYAQPANGIDHQSWLNNYNNPNTARFRRGVHSELSRENRMGEPRIHNESGTKVIISSQADYPSRSMPGMPGAQYPHNADYVPSYINALDGSAAPGAPVASVGQPSRSANKIRDKFGSVSMPRTDNNYSGDGNIGPVPNPTDYRNIHPTQWNENISGAPAQANQYAPRTSRMTQSESKEMLLDAPVPTTTIDVRKLQDQIRQLTAKLDSLEKKVGKVESSRSHDIILMVVLVVFLLFIMDSVFGFNKLT